MRACAAADRTGHALLHTLYQQALKNKVNFKELEKILDLSTPNKLQANI